MITRRVLSKYKHDGRVCIKNSFFVHSFHNISHGCPKINTFMKCRTLLSDLYNERSFSTMQHNNVHAPLFTNVVKNTSRCNNDHTFARTGLLNHAKTVTNSVRHYSSTSSLIDSRSLYLNKGIWKDISESVPVEYLQDALMSLHSVTGLPWWATIVVATMLTRTMITFPMQIYQQYIFAKVENLEPELKEIAKRTKIEAAYGVQYLHWTQSYANHFCRKSLREERHKLILRENCHPMKGAVLILIQLPLWVTFSFALRNMCHMLPVYSSTAYDTYMQLTTGGFGWMLNLTDVDHSFMLPLILGASNLLIIEVQRVLFVREQTKLMKYFTNFLRILTICMVPITSFIPSCLTLFWATSSFTGLLHNLLLLSPKIRRLGGVPKTNTELQHPYAELRRRIKDRFQFKGRTESATKL